MDSRPATYTQRGPRMISTEEGMERKKYIGVVEY
jgi:hypothetical protein